MIFSVIVGPDVLFNLVLFTLLVMNLNIHAVTLDTCLCAFFSNNASHPLCESWFLRWALLVHFNSRCCGHCFLSKTQSCPVIQFSLSIFTMDPLCFQGLPNSYYLCSTSKWYWGHLWPMWISSLGWPQTLSMVAGLVVHCNATKLSIQIRLDGPTSESTLEVLRHIRCHMTANKF